MAVSWVKSVQTTGSGVHNTLSFTGTTTGDLLIVMIGTDTTGDTFAIAASGTGWSTATWTILNAKTTATGTCCQSWWTFIPNTTATTITVTITGGSGFAQLLADEYTGMDGTSPIAGTNLGTGSGTPSITVTPTANNCQLWGGCFDNTTVVGSGFTKGCDDTLNDWTEHLTATLSGGSGAGQTVNFTGSGTWVLFGAAIQPPAASFVPDEDFWRGPTPPPTDPNIILWQ